MNNNSKSANRQGWNRTTELSVDLKTFLHHDRRMATGKGYLGVLRRDEDACIDEFRSRDAHFTFFEASSQKVYKRNPHVFVGQHITATRRPDGTLRLNFRPRFYRDFTFRDFCLAASRELKTIACLLGEEDARS